MRQKRLRLRLRQLRLRQLRLRLLRLLLPILLLNPKRVRLLRTRAKMILAKRSEKSIT